ncbi:MAG: hypothetical protein ACYTGW_21685 [Planctomycetota bacterium]|jgi:hypothetical protein
MRVLFATSLALVLCAPTIAQTQRTCPKGFETREGGHLTSRLGRDVDARYQFADGTCRGLPMTINQVDYRLDLQFYTSTSEGMGRSWTKVTLNLASTDVSKMTATFSTNILSTPSTVFNKAVTWKTSSGNPYSNLPQPAKWGDVASFPFSQPFFYIGNHDLLFDYTFRGGKLVNGGTMGSSTRYLFDGLAGNDLDYARNRGIGVGNFGACFDSGQTRFAWAAIEADTFSTNPPNPTTVHPDYVGRGNNTYAQLKGMFDIELSSQRTAKNANVIHALGTFGNFAGINIGAKCNLLFIDTTKPWIPVLRKADGNGEVGLFSNNVRSTLLGPSPFMPAFAGFQAWHQAAYADSVTNAFTLTTARVATVPNQPGQVSKKMAYTNTPAAPTGVLSPSSFDQTLPLLTGK